MTYQPSNRLPSMCRKTSLVSLLHGMDFSAAASVGGCRSLPCGGLSPSQEVEVVLLPLLVMLDRCGYENSLATTAAGEPLPKSSPWFPLLMTLWVTLCDVLLEWSAGAGRLDDHHELLLSSWRNSMLFCGLTMITWNFVLLHIGCSSWWLPHGLRVLREACNVSPCVNSFV